MKKSIPNLLPVQQADWVVLQDDVRRDVPIKKTVHIPGLLVQGEDVEWGAGKTDGISDRNNSAEAENLFLGSLASSRLERVAFNN